MTDFEMWWGNFRMLRRLDDMTPTSIALEAWSKAVQVTEGLGYDKGYTDCEKTVALKKLEAYREGLEAGKAQQGEQWSHGYKAGRAVLKEAINEILNKEVNK